MHNRLLVTTLGCLFLGACSENRCAPLYDVAHDLCTRAANEVYFSRISSSSHDCLQAYVAAHAELIDERLEVLSETSRVGVYRQLASLLSEQMSKRARDGSVSRLVSNLLHVEGLECSIVATDVGAFAKNSSLASATFVAVRWWPIVKYTLPIVALAAALLLYLSSSRLRRAVGLVRGPVSRVGASPEGRPGSGQGNSSSRAPAIASCHASSWIARRAALRSVTTARSRNRL